MNIEIIPIHHEANHIIHNGNDVLACAFCTASCAEETCEERLPLPLTNSTTEKSRLPRRLPERQAACGRFLPRLQRRQSERLPPTAMPTSGDCRDSVPTSRSESESRRGVAQEPGRREEATGRPDGSERRNRPESEEDRWNPEGYPPYRRET